MRPVIKCVLAEKKVVGGVFKCESVACKFISTLETIWFFFAFFLFFFFEHVAHVHDVAVCNVVLGPASQGIYNDIVRITIAPITVSLIVTSCTCYKKPHLYTDSSYWLMISDPVCGTFISLSGCCLPVYSAIICAEKRLKTNFQCWYISNRADVLKYIFWPSIHSAHPYWQLYISDHKS